MHHRDPVSVVPPGAGVRARVPGAWLLAGLFVLSLPAVTPRIYASDEVQYFAYLRSLWFDRDVSFGNEYRHFYDAGVTRTRLFRETFLEPVTETGRPLNFGTLGCAILWAPFYAAGDAVAHVMRAAGMDVATDGYSRPYVAAVCYGSAVYAFLAVLLSVWAARRIVSRTAGGARWAAVLGGLGVWLGTPLLFYMYIAPPMSHACSAFAVALFVAVWLRVRERWSPAGLALLGALAALVTMVREQDAFFAAGPALDFALAAGAPYVRRRRGANTLEGERVPRAWLGVAAAAATFLLVFTPQALAYLSLNGRILPSRLVSRKMTWTSPHALQVLGSPEHGLLFWTPLVVLALAGLVALLWRTGDTRRVAGCLLLMVAAQVYVAGSVESWTVAGAFGQRRFVGLTVLLVIGLAALADVVRSAAGRTALAGAVVLCVWWNIGLIVQFGAGLMDRQRLAPARNAYTTFVTLPRAAPNLAARFLFDRASFYRPPVPDSE